MSTPATRALGRERLGSSPIAIVASGANSPRRRTPSGDPFLDQCLSADEIAAEQASTRTSVQSLPGTSVGGAGSLAPSSVADAAGSQYFHGRGGGGRFGVGPSFDALQEERDSVSELPASRWSEGGCGGSGGGGGAISAVGRAEGGGCDGEEKGAAASAPKPPAPMMTRKRSSQEMLFAMDSLDL